VRVTPPEQLVDLLAAERRNGTPFDDAWPAAVARSLADVAGVELEAWRAALSETRPAWAASWERRPATGAQRALRAVAEDPDREALPAAYAGSCARCGQTIAAKPRGAPATYCSSKCRRSAHVERRQAA